MSDTCGFITVLDRPCGRPATWLFASGRVNEQTSPAESLCELHTHIATLEASFGCEHAWFTARPIQEGSPA